MRKRLPLKVLSSVPYSSPDKQGPVVSCSSVQCHLIFRSHVIRSLLKTHLSKYIIHYEYLMWFMHSFL